MDNVEFDQRLAALIYFSMPGIPMYFMAEALGVSEAILADWCSGEECAAEFMRLGVVSNLHVLVAELIERKRNG